MHRFFVSPQAIGRNEVTLVGPQAHQICTVLRLGLGDKILVLDNSGWQYRVEITAVDPGVVAGRITGKSLVATEPRTKITLYQGLLRTNKFEVVVQKCTELGVVAFVPTICERSLIANISEASGTKVERWQRIIAEAAEQCGRGKLPVLQPAALFPQTCADARGVSLLAWEGEDTRSLRGFLRGLVAGEQSARPFSLNVFIGPEGGFSPIEVQQARSYGIVPVSLGRRILRAETAAVAVAAIVLYEMGDLGE